MRFQTPKHDFCFEIPDTWWEFAEMPAFESGPFPTYPYSDHQNDAIEIVPLADIEPPVRGPGIALLKKFKIVPVLLALHSPECDLPPIEVKLNPEDHPYKYSIYNGYHRFYSSVAVGYPGIPVIVRPKDFPF